MVASMWEEQDLSASELANRTLIASNEIMEQRADVLGVLVNDAPRGQLALLGSQLKRKLDGFNIAFAGVIPFGTIFVHVVSISISIFYQLDCLQKFSNAYLQMMYYLHGD